MKKLSEHNKDQLTIKNVMSEKSYNSGVLCDVCEVVEMYVENPNVMLASYPPQQTVICPNCNKRDYKVL
jgi:hypothetical protein